MDFLNAPRFLFYLLYGKINVKKLILDDLTGDLHPNDWNYNKNKIIQVSMTMAVLQEIFVRYSQRWARRLLKVDCQVPTQPP
jgi:hypothetical protein